MNKILITGVGDSLGIATIRSIFEAFDKNNILIYAADADEYAAGLYYHGLSGSKVLPFASEESYCEEVLKYCLNNDINFFLPCSENEIITVVNNLSLFEYNNIKTLLPKKESLATAADKEYALELVEKIGFPVPKTFILKDCSEKNAVLDFIKKINYPIIAKPARAQGAKGIFHIFNRQDFENFFFNIEQKFVKYLIQEFIPGKQGSMYAFGSVVDLKGDIKAEFVSRSLKTKFDFGGPATVGESLYNKTIVSRSRTIINTLGDWSGPIMIEFILDPRDNEFKFIEINPRLWGYSYLSTAAGINIPKMIVEILKGKNLSCQKKYKSGVILIRQAHDIIVNNKTK